MSRNLLELRDVSISFGTLTVVDALDLDVEEGEIVSLIGPNGAGKTTVFNAITGVYKPDSGSISLDGENIVGLPPHRIATMGVARTFQSIRLFQNMSVRENVMVAGYGRTTARPWQSIFRTPTARREEREERELAEDLLSFFGERLVGYRFDQPAYNLSYANRRRLEIARAMAARPRILLLDEPAAGMNPARDAGDHGAHVPPSRREGIHGARDRARHARRRGRLRSRRGARPRREDRGGVVRPRRDAPLRWSRPISARARRRRSDGERDTSCLRLDAPQRLGRDADAGVRGRVRRLGRARRPGRFVRTGRERYAERRTAGTRLLPHEPGRGADLRPWRTARRHARGGDPRGPDRRMGMDRDRARVRTAGRRLPATMAADLGDRAVESSGMRTASPCPAGHSPGRSASLRVGRGRIQSCRPRSSEGISTCAT